MSISFYDADSSAWKTLDNCKVRVGGEWKQCSSVYTYVDGAWKKIWPTRPITITVTSDNVEKEATTSPSTLASYFPPVITVSDVTGDRSSEWVVPDNSCFSVGVTFSDGYNFRGIVTYSKTSDTTWGNPYRAHDYVLPAGTYGIVISPSGVNTGVIPSLGFDDVTVVNNLGTITVTESSSIYDTGSSY